LRVDLPDILQRFERSLTTRLPLLVAPHHGACRLFNGYTEGVPGLSVDVYGQTLLVHDALGPEGNGPVVDAVLALARERLPWLTAGMVKLRESSVQSLRNGSLVFGTAEAVCRKVKEGPVWYAVRLTLNRDASFYLDTSELRAWALSHLAGKRVLNTFSYTGSLSVAALGAGAARVLSTDLNRAFLTVAKDSYAINGFPVARPDFVTGDFFDVVGKLKRERALFDCVFVDPPFFSVTAQGRVDLEGDYLTLLNKARPLVADGGALVAINNGVFVAGTAFDATLAEVCAGGYAEVEARIPVPEAFLGTAETREGALPVDPAPYAHSTKMAVLRVKRKDGRT
jgi:23S rRNA (cytosine1962-C5)-methyltransferase